MVSTDYGDVARALRCLESPTTQLFVHQLVHNGEAYRIVNRILHIVPITHPSPASRRIGINLRGNEPHLSKPHPYSLLSDWILMFTDYGVI